MRIIILVMGLVLLCGCAPWVRITETEEGMLFEGNRPFDVSYEKGEDIKASASTKGKGLFEGMIQPVGQKIIE